MKKSKKLLLAFMIITLVQVAIIIFWGFRKENLYWDEFYTLEGAHYFSSSNAEEHYIDEDPDYKIGEWLPISFVMDTLIVGKEESLFNESLTNVLKKLTGYHNYSAFLNLAESVLSLDEFSIWPSIIINTIFFVLNQIVIFAMCRRLSSNETFPIAVCSMYGFSSICVSMALFIRHYMWATLLVSLFTFFHVIYYDENSYTGIAHIKRTVFWALAVGTLYISHNVAQYCVIYGVLFVVAFSILLLIKKGIKRFLYYSVPMYGGGFFYLYSQTEYLKYLFDFQKSHSEANTAAAATLDGIAEFKLSYLPDRFLEMGQIVGRYLYGSFFVMVAILCVAILAVIIRYVGKTTDEKMVRWSPFAVVPSVVALLYILFFAAFGLYEQVRYISFVFPELAIASMVLIYTAFGTDKYKYSLVTATILVIIVSVNFKGKVDMLYTGDRVSMETVRAFGADSYILHAGNHRTSITYAAALVAEDGDEFFVYDDLKDGELENLENNLRDKMILVGYYGVSTEDVQDMLKDNGYKVDWIADTYNNVFFTAVRE